MLTLIAPIVAENAIIWKDIFLVLAPIASGAVVWLWTEFKKSKHLNRINQLEDEKNAIAHYKDLYDRQVKENVSDTLKYGTALEKIEKLLNKMGGMEIKYARLEVYVEGLEEKLEDHNIKYRKWRDTPLLAPPSATPPPEPRNGSKINLKAVTPEDVDDRNQQLE